MKSIFALAATATVALSTPHHETCAFCAAPPLRHLASIYGRTPPPTKDTFSEAEFKHLGAASDTEHVRFSAALPWAPGSVAALDAKLQVISLVFFPRAATRGGGVGATRGGGVGGGGVIHAP
jgi:hypothetical protein